MLCDGDIEVADAQLPAHALAGLLDTVGQDVEETGDLVGAQVDEGVDADLEVRGGERGIGGADEVEEAWIVVLELEGEGVPAGLVCEVGADDVLHLARHVLVAVWGVLADNLADGVDDVLVVSEDDVGGGVLLVALSHLFLQLLVLVDLAQGFLAVLPPFVEAVEGKDDADDEGEVEEEGKDGALALATDLHVLDLLLVVGDTADDLLRDDVLEGAHQGVVRQVALLHVVIGAVGLVELGKELGHDLVGIVAAWEVALLDTGWLDAGLQVVAGAVELVGAQEILASQLAAEGVLEALRMLLCHLEGTAADKVFLLEGGGELAEGAQDLDVEEGVALHEGLTLCLAEHVEGLLVLPHGVDLVGDAAHVVAAVFRTAMLLERLVGDHEDLVGALVLVETVVDIAQIVADLELAPYVAYLCEVVEEGAQDMVEPLEVVEVKGIRAHDLQAHVIIFIKGGVHQRQRLVLEADGLCPSACLRIADEGAPSQDLILWVLEGEAIQFLDYRFLVVGTYHRVETMEQLSGFWGTIGPYLARARRGTSHKGNEN